MNNIFDELPEVVTSILKNQKTTLQTHLEEIIQDTKEKVKKEKNRDNSINVQCALVSGLFAMNASISYATLRELYVLLEREKISFQENQDQAELLKKRNYQMTETLCKILCEAAEMPIPPPQTLETIANTATDLAITQCNENIESGNIPWKEQLPDYTPEM